MVVTALQLEAVTSKLQAPIAVSEYLAEALSPPGVEYGARPAFAMTGWRGPAMAASPSSGTRRAAGAIAALHARQAAARARRPLATLALRRGSARNRGPTVTAASPRRPRRAGQTRPIVPRGDRAW